MKHQFCILIITAVLLVFGWTIVEYLMQSQIQHQYSQLSTYPVLIYSWDDSLLVNIKNQLKQQDYFRDIEYKTSEQAAKELIEKYDLKDAEEILDNKTLPNVLIITFIGNDSAKEGKLLLKDKFDNAPYKNRIMIEYQNDAWNRIWDRIEQINNIHIIIMAFMALTVSLVYIFKRLHYEHRFTRLNHLIHTKEINELRGYNPFWKNTAWLVLLPVGLVTLLYQILFYAGVLVYGISWIFFVVQLVVLCIASLIALPIIRRYEQESKPDIVSET